MIEKENRPDSARAEFSQERSAVNDTSTPGPFVRDVDLPTLEQIGVESTNRVLEMLDRDYADAPPDPLELGQVLISMTNAAIALRNEGAKDSKIAQIKQLLPAQVAALVMHRNRVVNLCSSLDALDSYDLLTIYCPSGQSAGLYTASEKALHRAIREISPYISTQGIREVVAVLSSTAPRVVGTTDRDLLPMNNGIYNYRTKELLPFSPEFVFTSKATTDFVPNAPKPALVGPDGEEFDVEEWVLDLFDGDEELAASIWQIIGAVLRPNVSWNKAAWFVSTKGNNGKGTLLEMIRALVGEGRWASLPLSEMGKDFMLEPLTRKTAILTDENDVGFYIEKAANLKASPVINALRFESCSGYFWKLACETELNHSGSAPFCCTGLGSGIARAGRSWRPTRPRLL